LKQSSSLLDGGDLQLLTLDQNVPAANAEPMRLTDEVTSQVGGEGVMVGYGSHGIGSHGHQNSSDDQRWGGSSVGAMIDV